MSEEMKPCPKCECPYGYEQRENQYTCPECSNEWEISSEVGEDGFIVKDINGKVLQNGDSVIVIKEILVKGKPNNNIFTSEEKPYNKDYFKTLWSRYKAQSTILEDLQTLYSFRHTGAIEIYKRTNNLSILQQAMGHSTLAVTLGYLRGLEIPSLRLEDMPRL